jgi:formate hydrogenlyase subunit 6/NADH:ubiquinone oxidoreductase subunit I
MSRFFLEGDRVPDLVKHLMDRGPVYAPHRQGRHSHAFARTTDPAAVVLDYPRTLQSVKKYFLPPREELLAFDMVEQSCTVIPAAPADAVFFAVHSYDVAAVRRLDHNFSTGHAERNYLVRREGAVFFGVSFVPDEFHFSGSVGIDPQDSTGCDAFLTKLLDGYVLDIVTARAAELLRGFALPPYEGSTPPSPPFHQHIYVPQSRLTTIMASSYDSPVWEEASRNCVECGTCNVVCPTCYCFDVRDDVDITVTHGTRARTWDACMLRGFGAVAGGEVFRASRAARQRHRVLRKFKYLSDDTAEPWCVGCGRCTAACTAGISIAGIVNRLIGAAECVPIADGSER